MKLMQNSTISVYQILRFTKTFLCTASLTMHASLLFAFKGITLVDLHEQYFYWMSLFIDLLFAQILWYRGEL